MWEPSNLEEKKFNAETYRLIGETQLLEFNSFLENFNKNVAACKTKFTNIYNVTSQPITIDGKLFKSSSVLNLVHSDNKILSRILASLGGICKEIQSLVNEAEWFYNQFLFCGASSGKKIDHYVSVIKIIEPLQKVHCYINRVHHVTILTLKQMSATLRKGFYVTSNTSSFSEIFNNLGDLLICILKLDSLLESQTLKERWFMYRRLVKNMYHNHIKYDLEREQLASFDKTLMVLESDLLMGGILKSIMEKCLEDKALYFQIKSCSLNQELNAYIYYLLDILEKDMDHILFVHQWLKLNVLFVFYLNIFGTSDKKLIKRILELNKKASACTLIGNILWYPEQFLLKHVQTIEKHINEKTIDSYRLNVLQYKSQVLPKESEVLCAQGCSFLADLKKITELDTRNLKTKHFQSIEHLLTEGITLMQKISCKIKWTLNVHAEKNVPITRSVLLGICKLIEVLKSLCIMFNKNLVSLVYIILLICQHLSHKALGVLHNIRKQFTQEKSYKEHQLDVLSSLNVCEQALRGPSTNETLLFVNLALSASGLSAQNLGEIRATLNKLELMINFTTALKNISDSSFLYWHQNYLLPLYFAKLISSKADVSRYNLVLNVLTDCVASAETEVYHTYSNIIQQHYFHPIGELIEINLRLQTHLHLQLPPSDPFNNYFALNFRKYLPVPLDKYYKSITNETEHYLSSVFYNLTTVVLHDWKTYGEMRSIKTMALLTSVVIYFLTTSVGESLEPGKCETIHPNISTCSSFDFSSLSDFGRESVIVQNGGILEPLTEIAAKPNVWSLEIINSVNAVVPNSLKNLEALKILVLTKNTLPVIEPDTFSNLVLASMVLQDDQTTEIKPDAFKNTKIDYIRIDNNKLKEIKKGVFNNLGAKQVDLFSNQISNIEDGSLADLPELYTLKLSHNLLTDFNAKKILGGEGEKPMQILHLQHNKLTKLDSDSFAGLSELKTLMLGFNEITTIEPGTFNLPNLRRLDLSNNKIRALDSSMFEPDGFKNIWELYLHNNELTSLSTDFLAKFPNLKNVFLSGNPWHCGCLDGLLKWVKEHVPDYTQGFRQEVPTCVGGKEGETTCKPDYVPDEANLRKFKTEHAEKTEIHN